MSDSQDIRDWAIANGINVNLKGPIPRAVKDTWARREAGPVPDGAEEPAEGTAVKTPPEPPPPDGGKKQAWWKGSKAKPAKEHVATTRRVSLEPLVTTAWGMASKMLEARALPVARVLQMQAPVAGMVIDETARGSAVDAMLQPLARAGEKGERVFALLGPPVLVGAICSNPAAYPYIRPVLKTSILLWMEVAEPAMKKAERRAKQFEEKFGGVDIDAMIDALFAPPEGFVQQPDGTWAKAVQEPVAA
jgi:hypothetical protein